MKIYIVMATDLNRSDTFVMDCFVNYEDAEAYMDAYDNTVSNHIFYIVEKDLWGQGTTPDEINAKYFSKNL